MSNIPRKKNRYDWINSVGKIFSYKYGNMSGQIKILEYKKGKVNCLNLQSNKTTWIITGNITSGNYVTFVNTTGKQGHSLHKNKQYDIGDIIDTNNHTYRILSIKYLQNMNTDSDYYSDGRLHYDVQCMDCKNVFDVGKYSIQKGACPYCSNYFVKEGFNDIPTTAPWMIPYFQGGYEEAKQYAAKSTHKIIPKCPDCGRTHDKQVSLVNLFNYHGFKCKCSDNISFPEKFMIGLLDQLNINYIYQAQTNEIGFNTQGKVYDFYIPSMNCIIETHGAQHYRGENIFYTSFEKQQTNDKFKERIAKENGIKHYIQIDCSQTSLTWLKEHIINSDVNQLFNLSNINWGKCIEYGSINLVKELCNYYNNYDVSSSDLMEKFHISRKGVVTYLKRGSELGWCKYKPNQSFFSCKPFIVYKNNQFICYGESAKAFGRKSKGILGEYISPSTIRKCLLKQLESFKGYRFDFINDLNLRREVLCKLL